RTGVLVRLARRLLLLLLLLLRRVLRRLRVLRVLGHTSLLRWGPHALYTLRANFKRKLATQLRGVVRKILVCEARDLRGGLVGGLRHQALNVTGRDEVAHQ